MTMSRRVAITGIGSVNAAGQGGSSAIAAALARPPEAIAALKTFPVERQSGLAAEVDDAELMALFDVAEVRRLSRICRMALAACRLAAREAGLEGGPRLGLAVGSEYGDFRSGAEFFNGFLRRGPSGLSPMIFPNTVMNSNAARIVGIIWNSSNSRSVNQSKMPPNQPARMPMGSPMARPINDAPMATVNDVRAPQMALVNVSRPIWSEPSQ